MDKRKSYYLIMDTEGANGLDEPLTYDLGMAVIDKKGNVYHTESLVIFDTFFGMPDVMSTAYYADKLPQYYEDIDDGLHRIVKWSTARHILHEICKEWNIKAIAAHNMFYDYNACNTTQRFLTCSKYRYFFPWGVPLWDTLKMAKTTFCKQKSFKIFCEENQLFNGRGQPSASAENLYKYITDNPQYREVHTALEDCLIEKDIFARAMQQKKKMTKNLFNPREWQPNTELQRRINKAVAAGCV